MINKRNMTYPVYGVKLGQIPYEEADQLQRDLAEKVSKESMASFVVMFESLPVVTLGKHADLKHLKTSKESLEEKGVSVVQTDRGGEVTAHMPGQLVVYPIFNLPSAGLGVKQYVYILEQAVINTLSRFDITASRDPINPGVWVKEQKVCAVGVRIKNRVTQHGIALNISNSLELFAEMVPCGIAGRGVTSMSLLKGDVVNTELVSDVFCECFARLLGCEKIVIQPMSEIMLQLKS